MTSVPDSGTPEGRPSSTTGDAPIETIPEWAPDMALPSSELLLAAFARVWQLHGSDIVDTAVDLVVCQRQHRHALLALADEQIGHYELQQAASELVSARANCDILTAVIDDAVDQQQALVAPATPPPVPIDDVPENTPVMVVQTESIGALVARMADLWVQVLDAVATDEEPPEATQLAQLCQGYDCLVAAIEFGQQFVVGR
ncbi:hypothetical protein OIE68_16940 [Nocardia vinacea]|uniref:hypothetical protein n=1 Tax=Nocardia vinacea TaxID=96468 RepID=UPI002E14668C|nr:hypothetical protein OIE68_16940 [Nocardia vinacea]